MERAELSSLLRQTGCAEERNGWTFLRDPHWSIEERAAAETQIAMAGRLPPPDEGWLCIRTGGSSGGLKFARHDEQTITAAVHGFCAHFAMTRVNAVGVLPPWHVSGLMARVRCTATAGRYIACEWKFLSTGEYPELSGGGDWVLSLVPTQLQRLLASSEAIEWLRRFRVVLIGGGPMWAELANSAAQSRVPIALSYGMTETAAMVTAQRTEEFAAGDRSAGASLPHASVRIDDGHVCIAAESLFRGYFPALSTQREFVTDDLGRLDEHKRLHLLGRRDAVIITGGKKVQPAEVEAALRASGEFQDVAVIGVPDAEWGELVVACYAAGSRNPDFSRASAALAAHQRPKRFVPITAWPRNEQGKINRAALAAIVTGA
jgi:o-succinylbenzoate---CoA ligase